MTLGKSPLTTRSGWVIRDDKPAAKCCCSQELLGLDHAAWCHVVTQPGGAFYYAGRDLEGDWWMDLANAASFTYRGAQQIVRELAHPRRLAIARQ